jgi:cytoskeletal protein RodZ
VKVEVRATYLKGMRERRGLTQRQLAKDLGMSQNYVPALEAGCGVQLFSGDDRR